MPEFKLALNNEVVIEKPALDQLLEVLRGLGYQTVGPRIEHEVLALGEVEGLSDLPQGYTSEQGKGSYRLVKAAHQRYFDITPGAQTWKKYLYPPRSELFTLEKENGRWARVNGKKPVPKYALIGVRACDMASICILDNVLIRKDHTDPDYAARRRNLFILAVDCLHPGDTCFCLSMGTGPSVGEGYDLKITELDDAFLVTIGSDAGLAVVGQVDWSPASAFHQQSAQRDRQHAEEQMGRTIENLEHVPELLMDNLEHPHWDDVGKRCLSCGSCTFVCPTCFCWDTEDSLSVTLDKTSRSKVWDSCFNLGYSAQAGGNTRPTTKARYRQWLTHKFSTWKDQFGTLGCVGCGRCITWCPAGIDVTQEVRAFQEELT